jgi:leucyl-tRNA synthetase
MKAYNHLKIEGKWQREWAKKKIYQTKNSGKKPKFYILDMFPYPSGEGLHVGHPKGYIATDVVSRMKRMQGFNVLHPMGFDAFGLPAENYAIKTKTNPAVAVAKNVARFKKQLEIIGLDYDWSREVNTTDPKFYKWTQWIFLKLLERGLAYESWEPVNWCPVDKTVLANEDVEGGKCERCGAVVEKKPIRQWVLKITAYADRLLQDIDGLNWPESIKESQRNWIGKSEGAEIDFHLTPSPSPKLGEGGRMTGEVIKVFTTRPDTIFGATYLVLAPEHPLVKSLAEKSTNKDLILRYIVAVGKRTEIERTAEEKEKTGVELKGIKAVNPANQEEIPVWIADYVLPQYGTGAIMAVPAHDERDMAFAQKYKLPIKQVVMPVMFDAENPHRPDKKYTTRDTVHMILRNKKGGILIQFLKDEKWGNLHPKNFLIGGIEEGESEMEAAAREIKEETGYTNFKFIQKVPFDVQANFFAAHKDVNRTIHVRTLVFDLIDEKRGEITEDEYFNKNSHEMKWIPEEKVGETLSTEDERLVWKFYQSGGFPYVGAGVLINSGKFDGLTSEEAKKKITEAVGGKMVTKFKIRDWVFSRQRYWGEPIPVLFYEEAGKRKVVPVPEKDLPVILPKVKSYEPTGTGESPLAGIPKWINVKVGKKILKRENNTMPQWAGSSWYYLRYMDPHNSKALVDKKVEKYWNSVDLYVGGAEHATRHLIYARFWHKFLYDIGAVSTNEPFTRLQHVGLITAGDGRKMSKRWGNVVNPDDVIKTFGADTLRLYEMFMGPFDQAVAWSEEAIVGPRRFLERVWKLGERVSENKNFARSSLPGVPGGSHTDQNFHIPKLLNKTIKKVTEDIAAMRFNTAVSSLMILVNEMEKGSVRKEDYKKFLQILAPFAPHITEELWSLLGEKKSINLSEWPKWDTSLIEDAEVKIVIQVNGKVRAEMMVAVGESEEEIKQKALQNNSILKYTSGQNIKRVVYVKGRLINIVF